MLTTLPLSDIASRFTWEKIGTQCIRINFYYRRHLYTRVISVKSGELYIQVMDLIHFAHSLSASSKVRRSAYEKLFKIIMRAYGK